MLLFAYPVELLPDGMQQPVREDDTGCEPEPLAPARWQSRGENWSFVKPVGSITLTVCFPSAFWSVFVITGWACVFKEICFDRQDWRETFRAIAQFEVHKTGADAAFDSKWMRLEWSFVWVGAILV